MWFLEAANLSSPGIAHAFFGRRGGVSDGVYATLNCGPGSSDVRERVIENRRRAIATLSSGARLVTLYQVHGAEVVPVTEPWPIERNPKADALVTNQPGIALGILTADCAPILLSDPEALVIGAAHTGWGGAISGVTDSVIAAMVKLGAHMDRIRAAIGPCISQPAYEVGPEFEARFVAQDAANQRFFTPSARAGHWQFDLPGYVAQRIARAGVEAVETLGACTYAREDDFFSYRRTTHRKEPDYGRQLSAIALL